MSLDDRLREGLPGLVADLDDPDASAAKVVASSHMRFRRRRTFGVLGTAVLFAGGALLAVAVRDDSPPTEVLGASITASTTSSANGPAVGGEASASGATTGEPSTTVAAAIIPVGSGTPSSATPCRTPLLVTKLPADYASTLVAAADGAWSVRGAGGRSLTVASASVAVVRPSGVAVQPIDLPTLGTKAEVSTGSDGSLLATLSVPGTRCGSSVSLLAQGMSDAELRTVLAGLRTDAECSARGFVSTPASQGAEIPAAVTAARGKVRAAALACDFDGLAALARANPRFVAEVPGVDVADQWRFADARGTQFMRAVVGLVDLVPRRSDASIHAGSTSWVWPWFAFDDRSTKLVEADFATLDRIFGAGYGARFRGDYRKVVLRDLAESYIGGLFVEIRADGVLASITTR